MVYERKYSEKYSIDIAVDYLKDNNKKVKLKKIYSKNGLVHTTSALLENKKIIASGKGYGVQSDASALFESIEHLFYSDIPKEEKYFRSIVVMIRMASC